MRTKDRKAIEIEKQKNGPLAASKLKRKLRAEREEKRKKRGF